MENGVIPPDKIQDPPGKNIDPSHNRDVCRTPMQWEPAPFAGFSTTEPWLPVSDDYMTRNVVVQDTEPTSMLNLYRQLLRYRRQNPVLQGGSYQTVNVPGMDKDCYVYLRTDNNQKRLIVLNMTGETCTLSIPGFSQGHVDLSTHLDRQGPVSLDNLELRSYEGIIVRIPGG
jgi:alpha-glucosidase